MMRRAAVILAVLLCGCGEDSNTSSPACGKCPATQEAGACPEASVTQPEAGASDAPIDAFDAAAETPAPAILRLMTFNIKHGEVSSLEAIADVILQEHADIVGLQEVDVDADRSGNVDQPHRLGQLTGMANLFRTALTLSDGGLYGLAVLSRYPIIISDRLNLTSGSEQRILVTVDIDVAGTTIPFCVTHLGLTASERTTQVSEILTAIGSKPYAVLVGDMNAQPDEPSMKNLGAQLTDAWVAAGVGDGYTIPADVPDRRIDFVWFEKTWAGASEAHVPVTQASDHRPVVVSVPMP
jgi:endonuclease/exonuclease/phosphatase family metal-dependent hydrolase